MKSRAYITNLGDRHEHSRGTLLDIGSSQHVNQSLSSQIYQEKPAFAAPEA